MYRIVSALILSLVLASGFLIGCDGNSNANNGYQSGYAEGFSEGYSKGHADGIAESKVNTNPTSAIDKPTLSSDEVRAIAGNDFQRFLDEVKAKNLFQSVDDSGKWSSTYLGNGKWIVTLTFPKLTATWYYFEKSATLQYLGITLN